MSPASALGAFFDVVLEAIFPIPPAEREVLGMGAIVAFKRLPRAEHPKLGEACSVFAYKDERVSRLIWSIKYKKSRAGASIAGYALYKITWFFAAAMPAEMRIVVIPMPVSRARRRERGFNQCELIMEEMMKLEDARHTGRDVSTSGPRRLIFSRDLLLRVRNTSRQTMKDRSERLESIKDIFAVNEKSVLLPELRRDPLNHFIVVIDDVITTGSTMKDAVDTFRRAGFANTYGLSVAH
jgi:predicted amidophosphoribosyltransferase